MRIYLVLAQTRAAARSASIFVFATTTEEKLKEYREGNIVHHYAPCAHLPKILASGFLRPSNADGAEEIPLLWFSANRKWEPTATKAVGGLGGNWRLLTLAEQLQLFGCCRFSMTVNDGRLMRWVEACRFAGRGYTKQRKMEASGKRMGANPADWFALADSVKVTETTFSVFDGRVWKAADIAATAMEWRHQLGDHVFFAKL